MPGGRPTSDPRGHVLAVRVAERHIRLLRDRAQREDISVSEALRRFLDESGVKAPHVRSRKPTAAERRSFDEVFAALGFKPRPGRRPRRS